MNAPLSAWELREFLPSRYAREAAIDVQAIHRNRQPFWTDLRSDWAIEAMRGTGPGVECLDAPWTMCAGSCVGVDRSYINSTSASSIAVVIR